jgi:hypothetical protein
MRRNPLRTPRVVVVGAHQIELEQDLAVLRWRGYPSFDDVRGVFEAVAADREGRSPYFLIADMRHSEIPSAETRRWAIEWVRSHPLSGFASFGGSVAIRSILSLMMNAIRLIDRRQPPTRFFETESAARAWVEHERVRHAAR